ncbi:EF-P 5-aminopentanol modification-associated protein YfmH [Thermoanaerobacterium sp. DL9XJH110]|uniref:EF-P 5-aminopentanol modification-associated protein YfmH n=1 Tax=Thermoanaerobacterium sp. DL9XJH110 TaxID=3386643 RepID=UPI003BB69787
MDLFLGEKLFSRRSRNGLWTYVLPKKNFSKVFALYSTHYGSIDSEFIVPATGEHLKVPEGIAHFLEHKMFEMEYGNVFDKFAELGTSSNAFTNYTSTTYLFSATSNFKQNLKLLLEFVDTPYFTKENVEKEKGIITQELRMYEDDPEWQVLLNLLRCLYHNHPVRIDIGGTVDSIQKIDVETLYKCYNTFYHPSNMLLFVTGCAEPEDVFNLVDEHEKEKNLAPQAEIKRFYPEEPDTINMPSAGVNLDVAEPLFLMGFKDVDVGYDGYDLLKKEITTAILLEILLGKSSQLYEHLYEEGLIDDRFSFSFEGQKDYGFCTIGGETRDPERLHHEILDSISSSKENGLAPEDLARVKKKFLGDFIQGFNSLEFIATSFVTYYHKKINLFDYIKALQEITLNDVTRRLHDFFDFSRHAVSVVMPKK